MTFNKANNVIASCMYMHNKQYNICVVSELSFVLDPMIQTDLIDKINISY